MPSPGGRPNELSVDLFIPFFRWVLKTRMWFILHQRPDDTQTVTNASKLTVQETHSACQAVQNQCLCNQKSADTAALYGALMHVRPVCVNVEYFNPRPCGRQGPCCDQPVNPHSNTTQKSIFFLFFFFSHGSCQLVRGLVLFILLKASRAAEVKLAN